MRNPKRNPRPGDFFQTIKGNERHVIRVGDGEKGYWEVDYLVPGKNGGQAKIKIAISMNKIFGFMDSTFQSYKIT